MPLSVCRTLLVVTLMIGLPMNCRNESEAVHLVRDGVSTFSIHVADDAPTELIEGAQILRDYMQHISGAALPVVRGDVPRRGCIALEIDRAQATAFGEDGFRIRAKEERISLTASTGRGIHNAVYTFLETYLGCRKYSPRVAVIPQSTTISLPEIDDTQIPALSIRMQDFEDSGYNAWHKLSTRDDWGLFVHTFKDLVPPEKYFADHPEYFTENRGVRVSDGQLCLSHPDVFRIVVEELRRRMNENPNAKYWSVSQNDTYLPCTCDACRAIDQEEGSHSGSMLRFVNRLAAEFPDKVISTLAYQYTRAAPKLTKPAPNVNIMLCSIECDRSRPIAASEGDASFVKDVEGWSRLTHNIFLWDYVIQFRNLVSPFPNLFVLQPNLQFFVRNGIRAVFEQGLHEMRGEFAELRAYLISKLLWDPDIDVDGVMNDFLQGFYGEAAPHIRRYIERMQAALVRSGEGLSCFGYPFPSEDGYLSAAMIDTYRGCFDEAEAAVATRPEFLARVQTARLPLQYARLEQAKILADSTHGCFERDRNGARRVRPEIAALVDTFHVRCERAGVTKLWEHGIPPQKYHETFRRFLEGSTTPHLALGCSVALTTPASHKYLDGWAAGLTDGVVGWDDYHMHWLGFEGEDMGVTIDLGHITSTSRINTAFLQDIASWIFLPTVVEFFVSENGERFESLGMLPASEDPRCEGALRSPASLSFKPRRVRYVRVKAVNMKQCPSWHKGAGGKAWVFCDEIQVY